MRPRVAVLLIASILAVACGKMPTEPGLPSVSSAAPTPAPTRVASIPVRPAPTPTPNGGLDEPCRPWPKCQQ
jgi:hypothetical protein